MDGDSAQLKSSANCWLLHTLTPMLDDKDIALLDFERAWACVAGPKDWMIEISLGLTAEAYYARLRELIFDDRARAYDPLTLRRLERLIERAGAEEAVV